MCNLMRKQKKDYSLNQYEATYLVYYLITQNIEINCDDTFLFHLMKERALQWVYQLYFRQ